MVSCATGDEKRGPDLSVNCAMKGKGHLRFEF